MRWWHGGVKEIRRSEWKELNDSPEIKKKRELLLLLFVLLYMGIGTAGKPSLLLLSPVGNAKGNDGFPTLLLFFFSPIVYQWSDFLIQSGAVEGGESHIARRID